MPSFIAIRDALVPSAFLMLLLASPSRADIDLTGQWLKPGAGFVEIVQAGTDVTITWTGGSPVYTGTFNQTSVDAVSGPQHLNLSPTPDGSILQGVAYVTGFPSLSSVFLSRCECFDENVADGDGCDSECRIEECYSCTGEPSVCVPSADAAACNDRDDCTTGETCTAGACGAGSPVSPCVNVSGDWRVASEGYLGYLGEVVPGSSSDLLFVQENGALRVYSEGSNASDAPLGAGSIDPSSGAMDFRLFGSGFCSTAADFAGTASGDSSTFAGTIGHYFTTYHQHCSSAESAGTGTRCDATLGCNLEDCTGHPDGTPCSDDNLCTNRDACQSGECIARTKCNICEACDELGDCDDGPEPDCRPSATATSSQIMLKSWGQAGEDQVRWSWKKGAATSLEEFGDPAGTNEMALCLYNGSELIYQYDLDPDAACEAPPCWTEKADRLSFKSKPLSLLLRSGSDGRAAISLKSRNAELEPFGTPLLPITVPLQAQFRIDNGACFDATFDTGGVKTSDDGSFKAKGGLP